MARAGGEFNADLGEFNAAIGEFNAAIGELNAASSQGKFMQMASAWQAWRALARASRARGCHRDGAQPAASRMRLTANSTRMSKLICVKTLSISWLSARPFNSFASPARPGPRREVGSKRERHNAGPRRRAAAAAAAKLVGVAGGSALGLGGCLTIGR